MVKVIKFCRFLQKAYCSTVPKVKKSGQLLISCRRKNYDHYSSTIYSDSQEIPLNSKGWSHSKAKGDYFTIYPLLENDEKLIYPLKDLRVHDNMIVVLNSQGINKATEFQCRAVEAVQSGKHCLLAAETGCGKTLSYLLPIIQDLSENKSTNLNTPKAVVIVPNRELAYQVAEVAKVLSDTMGVNAEVLIGGRTKRLMMNPVFKEIDILIATPGVLGKLSSVGIYKLDKVRYTVLDEADTLIDDSFIERMNMLIMRLPQSQMILVSATLPRSLPDILIPIESRLKHIVSPKIHRPLLNITQKFWRLTKSSKPGQLLQIAKANKHPMLIFTNKNDTCNWLAMFLRENGLGCANINGEMNYNIRIEQWNQFVSGQVNILSATDVGSRGLNTVQVKHVLNYDFPLYAADYIHRIGRVGRLGSPTTCKVTNFVSGEPEIKLVQQIELAIRKNQVISNVDGNITRMVQRKIARRMMENGQV